MNRRGNTRIGRPATLFLATLLLAACTATPPPVDPGAGSGGSTTPADAGTAPAAGGGGRAVQPGGGSGGASASGGATDDEPSAGGAGGGGGGGSTGGGGSGSGGAASVVDAGPVGPGKDAALAADTNYNTPLVCTSGDHWTNGDRGATAMYPGRPCIACHVMKRGPAFSAAGTIFATAHEPDDCNGVDGLFTGAVVIITDATGKVFTTGTNFAGNFEFFTVNDKITPPYRAKVVVANGKERAMVTAQTSGDCNACHTVTGATAAPGRIMLP